MTATTAERLYWAETGEITCDRHAPFKGSDTWVHGRWSEMTTTDRLEWAKYTGGTSAKCEVCK